MGQTNNVGERRWGVWARCGYVGSGGLWGRGVERRPSRRRLGRAMRRSAPSGMPTVLFDLCFAEWSDGCRISLPLSKSVSTMLLHLHFITVGNCSIGSLTGGLSSFTSEGG